MDAPALPSPGFGIKSLLLLALAVWTEGVSSPWASSLCLSKPCQNGGMCHEVPSGYLCQCQSVGPALPDQRCGDLGNATCTPTSARDLACQCAEGPSARSPCLSQVRLCAQVFCGAGGTDCRPAPGYRCSCGPDHAGRSCESPVDPCHPNPCRNGAICRGRGARPTCFCVPGFQGRYCEVEVDECVSQPCLNGATCLNRIGRYQCVCRPGYAGASCQEDVNECDASPCQNGGSCQNTLGGYVCVCPRDYGGQDCSETLDGCAGHECQNRASCRPFLSAGTRGYDCLCPPGFTGSRCQTSTTFSFERRGHLLLQSPVLDTEAPCNVTLSFRTVLPDAVLFQRGGGGGGGALLSLELRQGRLRLGLNRGSQLSLELSPDVTDGLWHGAQAVLGDGFLVLTLLDGGCEGGACEAVAQVESGPVAPDSALQDTVIGGAAADGAGGVARLFIGCLRDVFVDSQLMVPEDWLSSSAVNVTLGCVHRDRCQDNACQNGGECVNLWQTYQCRCQRPYEGLNCSDEYITARFGNEDLESHAVFRVDNSDDEDAVEVSMFLRTRKTGGLLLVLSNSSGQYLRAWLEQGRVKVQAGGLESVQASASLSDGDVHFVRVTVTQGRLTLFQSGQSQGSVMVQQVRVQAGDAVHVGGSAEAGRASSFGGHFKGCVQDLQLNGRRLQFFPLDVPVRSYALEHMSHVTAGCPGDESCAKNPCQNGGACYSEWDGFSCSCPPNTSGLRCEEVRWCQLSPCPAQAACQTLATGYECISNATFEEGAALSYRGNGRIVRSLTSISFAIRTRKRNAAVLHAERGSEFVTVSVQDGLLFLELLSGVAAGNATNATSPVSLSSHRPVSDGLWHHADFFMVTPWTEASRWTLVLDQREDPASTSEAEGGGLDFLRDGVDVLLGGLGPDAGWNLAGCLSTVEVGGIALPYHDPSDLELPRLQEEQFLRTSPGPVLGCRGSGVCEPDPCLNGGRCRDLFNLYSCSCGAGWAGPRCEVNEDTCASRPCVRGRCSVRGLAYECACPPGYAGTNCEKQADVCEGHACANGATCLHGINKYACLCTENFTGPWCIDKVEEIPWYIVDAGTKRPKLPVSVCGDERRNYTCFNGGNCSATDLSCDCPPGFTGHRCQQEVDECKSNPCLNGGYCRNLLDRFQCVCDLSFAGDVCQIDEVLASVGRSRMSGC
ncbi:protein crumbs homolog 1-like isoform X2 [Denticeps clupeoides]|uniref:protein crumbs homolog 1-like isoform X2 n=1 Tax=Denticeps clupeoides TaxID=299321 RepID=UPI0010A5121F|nr:protein crumbs homolog 1-like isoform X2 [Denticeps clupeoides]